MQSEFAVRVGELGDRNLLARLKWCVAEDRRVSARLLEHFAEVDARGLFRDLGFSSMFDYAVRGLHMSESEAGLRITVGRLMRRFPQALELFSLGEVHLTALRLLAPRLTPDNLHLLQQARFKSKHEVLELIARHFPQSDVSDSIRRLPAQQSVAPVAQSSLPLCAAPGPVSLHQRSAMSLEAPVTAATDGKLAVPSTTPQSNSISAVTAAPVSAATSGPVFGTLSAPTSADAPVPTSAHASVAVSANVSAAGVAVATAEIDVPLRGSPTRGARLLPASVPLSEGRFKVQFTAGQRLNEKLRQAQELMRHLAPNGDLAVVLERAVDLLIAERKKQLFGKVSKPRRYSPKPARNFLTAPCPRNQANVGTAAAARLTSLRRAADVTFLTAPLRRITAVGRFDATRADASFQTASRFAGAKAAWDRLNSPNFSSIRAVVDRRVRAWLRRRGCLRGRWLRCGLGFGL